MTRPIVGPMPTPAVTPVHPTPWRVDTSDWQNAYLVIRDANSQQVTDLAGPHSTGIAQAIVDAINAQHAAPAAPVLRDFVDHENDTWFEVAPGKVMQDDTREIAERRFSRGPAVSTYTHNIATVGYQPFRDATTRCIIPEHR